jgi:hypothetical protein
VLLDDIIFELISTGGHVNKLSCNFELVRVVELGDILRLLRELIMCVCSFVRSVVDRSLYT